MKRVALIAKITSGDAEAETPLPNKVEVLYCGACNGRIRLSNSQRRFCPTCGTSDDGAPVKLVLCCDECKKPLAALNGGGYHCLSCNFSPSMQDLCFEHIEKVAFS